MKKFIISEEEKNRILEQHSSIINEQNSDEKLSKMKKLKKLLELVSDVDIMYHKEHKDFFFEWFKDGEIIHIWLSDFI